MGGGEVSIREPPASTRVIRISHDSNKALCLNPQALLLQLSSSVLADRRTEVTSEHVLNT